jgi:hypothetical protein
VERGRAAIDFAPDRDRLARAAPELAERS